jgi:diguanylate cyclase (GGDEF)-like protein
MDNCSFSQLDAGIPGYGTQDLIIDLLNSLSAIKSLSEINCEIADEKTLIREALASLIQNQDMERCSFFAVDNNDILINVTGLSVAELPNMSQLSGNSLQFRIGEGIIGAAAASNEIQYCRNCSEDQRFAAFAGQENVPGCIVCAPVFTLHRVLIGVLNISHPTPEFFTDWHLRLLELYTNVLGQLITNRRLFQEMETQIAIRTKELERLVDETRLLKDHYASMSMLDQLTGLHNRRYFYDQVGLAIAQNKRYQNPFCLLVIDIDHFKTINDQYGHIFGDQVLIGVAAALKQQVRNSDILVRFGGEEFVIIFTNTCHDNGRLLAERIRQEIKLLSWTLDSCVVKLTLSIGVYCTTQHRPNSDEPMDIDQIIHYADTACYAAKTSGRDRVEIYKNAQSPDSE